jgi:hypothetical protein
MGHVAHDQAISATGTSREQRVSSFHCISESSKREISKVPLKIGTRSQLVVTWGDRKNSAKGQSTGFSCRRDRCVLQVPVQLGLDLGPC